VLAAHALIMSGTVDAREELDGAIVRPALPLPIALIVAVVHFDFGDPFDVLDAVNARDNGPKGESMHFGKLNPVHHVRKQYVSLHGTLKRDAAVVTVRGPKYHISSPFRIDLDFLEERF